MSFFFARPTVRIKFPSFDCLHNCTCFSQDSRTVLFIVVNRTSTAIWGDVTMSPSSARKYPGAITRHPDYKHHKGMRVALPVFPGTSPLNGKQTCQQIRWSEIPSHQSPKQTQQQPSSLLQTKELQMLGCSFNIRCAIVLACVRFQHVVGTIPQRSEKTVAFS